MGIIVVRKILFVCPGGKLEFGGALSNHQLILYLVAKGYEVRVVTSWLGEYNKMLTELGIKNLAGDYNWWTDNDDPAEVSVRCLTALQKIAAEINRFNPDIVITNALGVPWGALAAAITNKPHIWIAREFPQGDFAYLDSKMGFVRKYANIVMANSQELASYISDTYRFPTGYFYSYVDSVGLKLNGTISQTRIVSPNYISHRKNQTELIQALGILKKRDKSFNTPVILIGGDKEKDYANKVRSMVKQHSLENIVSFHGFVSEPWSMVGPNDILVQTSLSESIGRTTTEAMKLGIPVVASDIPGHREAFELGGGTLYRSQDPEDLADKLQQALTNPLAFKKTAQKVQAKVLKSMSEEACNLPMIEAIEKFCGQANPQGELNIIAPYLMAYITDREQTVRAQSKTIAELFDTVAALRNSTSYRLGQSQVNAVRRVLSPLRKR